VLSQVSFFDGSTSCPFAGASQSLCSIHSFFNPPLRVTCIFSISNHFIDWLCAHQSQREKLHTQTHSCVYEESERLMHQKERESMHLLSARRLDIQSMWHLKSLQKADLLYILYIMLCAPCGDLYTVMCMCHRVLCVFYVRPGTWGTTLLMAHLCVLGSGRR
jgi:hypothetical protein